MVKSTENEEEQAGIITAKRVIPQVIEDEMKKSFLAYAMSVIISRALPDVRDGLKPVHRRILYTMNEIGVKHNTPHKKSARIVGEVMGKYHPHGDSAIYETAVRMAQDFSLRYPLIDGQGNFGCFTKDTKIQLCDGRHISFEELIQEEKKGIQNYTYTIDDEGNIKIALIQHPRITKKNAEIISLLLDNGEIIKCTPDHRFMLKNRTYKEAQYLETNDQLMPFYSRPATAIDCSQELAGYLLVKQPITQSWEFAHHIADAYNIDQGVYTVGRGRVRHHKDFNKYNNNPENIQRMHWKEHWMLHSQLTKHRHANDKAYVENIAMGRKKFFEQPENKKKYQERMSERNRENWKNPEYRAKIIESLRKSSKEMYIKKPHLRKIMSEQATKTLKRMWKNSSYREFMRTKIIKGNKNHTTNSTGKKKFLKICNYVLEHTGTLNHQLYSSYRNKVYPYGKAPQWQTAWSNYYDNKELLDVVNEATENHRVVGVNTYHHREDVYDLTIENTHNFALAAGIFVHNSVDGDSPAAMRYTEARMRRLSEELLLDIDKETVDFVENYDGQLKEPTVLPSKAPTLLINGSSGIAVGMATNIPPHNLREIGRAIIEVINNPQAELKDLLAHVKGPDFPTGGIICGTSGIQQAYLYGRGKVRVRAVITDETTPTHKRLVITEIPYMVNKSTLIEHIAACVHEKKIEGIRDLRDESDRKGMRVVIELKRDANAEVTLNQLYKYTRCQETFGINSIALVNGEPRTLGLKEMIDEFIKHREEVVRRRTTYDLRKAQERAHIIEGLVKALDNIDKVVELIKKAETTQTAHQGLMSRFALSEEQSKAILEMKLSRLAALEQKKLRDELETLRTLIIELKDILDKESRRYTIIKDEMKELIEKYGDERRTHILEGFEGDDIDIEDLIDEEDMVVTISAAGYIKRTPIDTYKAQRRGGKGITAATTKEDDALEHLFIANTHHYLLIFTDQGRVHWVKVYKLPETGRYSKGTPIVNLISIEKDERVSSVIPVKEFNDGHYLIIATKKGTVKKTTLESYSRPRAGGIKAINLVEGDDVVDVKMTDGEQTIMIATAKGMAVKFDEKDVRPIGRTGTGVRGVRLGVGDYVISMITVEKNSVLATITENGYGKRTSMSDYRLINRGGKGVRNIICSPRNGKVVAVMKVTEDDDLLFISKKGIVIRTEARNISVIGRNTQGVRLMRLSEGDKVVSAAKIARENVADEDS